MPGGDVFASCQDAGQVGGVDVEDFRQGAGGARRVPSTQVLQRLAKPWAIVGRFVKCVHVAKYNRFGDQLDPNVDIPAKIDL